MDLKSIVADVDWKKVVRTTAPTIATVLTGGNPLAGMAVSAISTALLGKSDAPIEEVQAAIMGATPADLVKLKEADQVFKLEMARCGVDLEEIAAKDRDSAREREIKTGDLTPRILAVVYTIGFFFLMGWILWKGIPAGNGTKEVVLILIGAIAAAVTQILNYYFGSSKGSSDKNSLLAKKS
jgi:hypothetical protein